MSFVSSNNCQHSNKPPFLNGCSLTRQIYQTSIPPGKLSVPSPLTFFDSRGMRNTWVSFSECMTLERGRIRGNSQQSVSLNWYIHVAAKRFRNLQRHFLAWREGGGQIYVYATHWFLRRSQLPYSSFKCNQNILIGIEVVCLSNTYKLDFLSYIWFEWFSQGFLCHTAVS